MTCSEAQELLDAFVDAELPAPTLRAVARHAGTCALCDEALREREALHDAVEATLTAEAGTLDLTGVWPAVAAAAEHEDRRRVRRRTLRAAPVWGAAGLALAASAVLWLRAPVPETKPGAVAVAESEVTRVARPNRAVIDRLRSDARVALRSDRKKGTMLIMVSADGAGR